MDINKIIRDRRIHLGLSDTNVAKLSGLSIHEYCDIEQHQDEFLTAISLANARNLCEILQLGFSDIFKECGDYSRKLTDYKNSNITQVMHKVGLSRFDVADKIGFEAEVISALENNACSGANLPISVLFDIESCLGMEKSTMVYFVWINCR